MAEAGYPPPAADEVVLDQGVVTVKADDVHIHYRVDEDASRSLRDLFATAGRRRHRRYVHAVKGVSFTAHAGEVIGVIGSNGSGKSSLMRAIAGLQPVSEGAVYARSTPMLLGVGAVLNRQLSGRRNIMLGGLALGLTADEVKAKESAIIEFAGIGHAIDRPMRTYSAGMSARLQFSISAAVRPEILIIDEALAVGDREFKQKSQERIQQLRESAGTVFIVSHGMKSIRTNCTRVLWIEDGVLRADGDPDEVTARYDGRPPRGMRRKKRKRAQRRAARVRRQRELLEQAAAEARLPTAATAQAAPADAPSPGSSDAVDGSPSAEQPPRADGQASPPEVLEPAQQSEGAGRRA